MSRSEASFLVFSLIRYLVSTLIVGGNNFKSNEWVLTEKGFDVF